MNRERNAQLHSATMLEPMISGNPLFSKVVVRHTANWSFFSVSGEVHSEADLDALKKLITEAQLPRQPHIIVEVVPKTNE
jgi:hypothetical protein